mgnify:CR=1 FL=1
MTVWAHVRSGLVVAMSEGLTPPPDELSTLVTVPPGVVVLPGFAYDGAAFTPAGPEADEAAARERHWTAIKAERDRRIQEQGYVAGGKRFHGDTFSRTQQMGLVMLGASIPPGLQWKTMDGSFVAMTQTLAQQVFAAAAASDIALFGHAEALRAQVNAAEDPSSVDITAGWPA